MNISHETNKERGKKHEIWMCQFVVGMNIRLSDDIYPSTTATIAVQLEISSVYMCLTIPS